MYVNFTLQLLEGSGEYLYACVTVFKCFASKHSSVKYVWQTVSTTLNDTSVLLFNKLEMSSIRKE
jgi:hypothetical protein